MKGLLSRLSRKLAGPPAAAVEAPAAGSTLDASAMIEEAIGLHRAGRMADAAAIYQRVLVLDAANFDALHMLGALAHQTGDAARAVELIGRAVEVRPDDASARGNLGLVYRALGRLDEAEGALRRAVQINPASDRVHASLGVVLRDRGDLAGAEAALKHALQLNPGNDEALSNLASVCKELNRHAEAEAHFRAALTLRPDRVEYWSNLAGLYLERGEWQQAEACLQTVVEKGAATAETFSHLGFALLQLDRPNEAETACREALARRDDYPDALVNLASVLKALGDLEGAEASCRRALGINAGHIAALVNLGTIRTLVGDVPEAEANFRNAMALDPRCSGAKFNLSNLLLLRGEYGEGFELFESRFDSFKSHFNDTGTEHYLHDVHRRWQGGPISGRRMVVWSEQGYGDNLMMMRYLPMLKELGADHLTVICAPEMARIMAEVACVDRVVRWDSDDMRPLYDLHCPAMSLPYCFRSTIETVPESDSCMAVPENLIAEWSERLAGVGRPRVGLAWAGSRTLRDDARRSIELETFAPIFEVANVRFLSLQKGWSLQQASARNGTLADFMGECKDFMDTAAFICNLDLVISVDTAVAHLAGALGKPVWLLNRAGSEWRWGLIGERTTWYRTMRIFRQECPLEWVPVMNRVATELQRFAVTT